MQLATLQSDSHIFSQILTDSSTAHAASYLSSSFHVRIALSSCQCVARYHYGTLTSVHSTFEVYPHLSLHYKTRCIFSQIITNYPPLKSPETSPLPPLKSDLRGGCRTPRREAGLPPTIASGVAHSWPWWGRGRGTVGGTSILVLFILAVC